MVHTTNHLPSHTTLSQNTNSGLNRSIAEIATTGLETTEDDNGRRGIGQTTKEGEIPEDTSNAFGSSLIDHTSTKAILEQKPAAEAATHLSHTYHFSQLISHYETEKTNQIKDTVYLQPSVLPISELYVDQSSNEDRINAFIAPSSTKLSVKPLTQENFSSHGASEAIVSLFMSPLKQIDCLEDGASSSVGTVIVQETPAKFVLTPEKLMSATRPSKRCCYMSPDDSSTTAGSELIRRPPSIRSLKFDSPVKNAVVVEHKVNDIGVTVDNDNFDIFPEDLLQPIREKALEEKDPIISQAERRQKSASLPKLFDVIRFLFQSINRFVVTKEEFMHQLVANHLDIVDIGEVEEQVQLLEELLPEWISEKLAFSGDILVCVNKMCSLDTMPGRILEAK